MAAKKANEVMLIFAGDDTLLKKALTSVKNETGGLEKGIKSLGGSVGSVGSQITSALSSPVTAVVAVGAAITKMVSDGITGFIALAEETKNLQRATGLAAEDASGLIAVGEKFNVSAGVLTSSMAKFTVNIGKNSAALQKYGIDVVRGANGNVDMEKTLEGLADAYNKTEDPAKRAAMLQVAFGKGWKDMVPILEGGKDAIKAAYEEANKNHQILSADDVKKGEDFRLAVEDLKQSFKGLERAAGEGLIPILSKVVAFLDLETRGANVLGGAIVDLTKKVWDMTGVPVINWFSDLKDGLVNVWNSIIPFKNGTDAGTKSAQDFGHAVGDASSNVNSFGDAIHDQYSEVMKAVDSQRSYDKSLRDVKSAQDDVVTASKKLNDLIRTHGVDAKQVASTLDNLTQATIRQTGAQKALDDSYVQLVKDQSPATYDQVLTATEKITTALLDQKSAQKGLADAIKARNDYQNSVDAEGKSTLASADDLTIAQGNVNDTLKEYNKVLKNRKSTSAEVAIAHKAYTDALQAQVDLQKQGVPTAEGLAAANDTVARATIGADTATVGLHTAQTDLNTVMQIGTEMDPKIISDRTTIAGLTTSLATATHDTANSQAAYNLALAGDPNYKGDVAALRKDLGDKTQHVADAQWDAAKAAVQWKDDQGKLNVDIASGNVNVKDLMEYVTGIKRDAPGAATGIDMMTKSYAGLNTTVSLADMGAVAPAGVSNGPEYNKYLKTLDLSKVDPIPYDMWNMMYGGNVKVPGKAAGGSFHGPTMVGENGPEIVTGSGMVIPNNRIGQSMGGGTTTVQIVLDGHVLAETVLSQFLTMQERIGPLGIKAQSN